MTFFDGDRADRNVKGKNVRHNERDEEEESRKSFIVSKYLRDEKQAVALSGEQPRPEVLSGVVTACLGKEE